MSVSNDKPKLTVKEKKFVKEYVSNGGNGTHAVLASYDTTNSNAARAMAPDILARPSVRDAVEKALEKHGITIDAAVAPIAAGLKATNDDGKTDHSIRLKASGMALNLMGVGKGDGSTTIVFNTDARRYINAG